MMHAIAQTTLLANILSSCNLVSTFLFQCVSELYNMDYQCMGYFFMNDFVQAWDSQRCIFFSMHIFQHAYFFSMHIFCSCIGLSSKVNSQRWYGVQFNDDIWWFGSPRKRYTNFNYFRHRNVSHLNLWIACWIAIAIWTFRRSSEHSEPLNIVSEHLFPAIWTFRRSSPWTFRNAASNCSTNDYLCMCVLCVWAICATLLPVRPSWFSISTCHYSLSPLYSVRFCQLSK